MFQKHVCDVICSTCCLKRQHSIICPLSYLGRYGTPNTVRQLIFFISTTEAQPISIVNTFYNQVCFQITINLNKILETRQAKTAFCLS